MKRNSHYIVLNVLIIVGCAFLYCSCSYLFAKWFVLSSAWYDTLGPGVSQDLVMILFAYVLAGMPSALVIGHLPMGRALRLALPTGVLAISFMVMKGYFFVLLYTIPAMLSVILVLALFMGMTALVCQVKISCAGCTCCRSIWQK